MTNNTITLDVAAEIAELRTLHGQFSNAAVAFERKARLYLDYGLQSGNLDMLRALREAIGFATVQKKLDQWLKVCAPISKKKNKDESVSYRKDKTRAREEGWRVVNEEAYSLGFIDYKKPQADKGALTLVQALEALKSRIGGAMDVCDDNNVTGFNNALQSLYDEVCEALERAENPVPVTNNETVTLIKRKAGKE
jgi:hypothetical protein